MRAAYWTSVGPRSATAAPTASPTPSPTASPTASPTPVASASPVAPTGVLTGTLDYPESFKLSAGAVAGVALVEGKGKVSSSPIVATQIIDPAELVAVVAAAGAPPITEA